MRSDNAAALTALKQSSKFRYLDASIVRLFRDLQVSSAVPAGEEDLT